MLVLDGVIIVDVRGDDELAHVLPAGQDAVVEMGVADVEAAAQVEQARIGDELAEVCGRGQLAGGVFSRAMVTPRSLAKMARCSRDCAAASKWRGSPGSREPPICCTRRGNGKCSARSRARLISSTASMRRPRSGSEMERGVSLSCMAEMSRTAGAWTVCTVRLGIVECSSEIAGGVAGAIVEMGSGAEDFDVADAGVGDVGEQRRNSICDG